MPEQVDLSEFRENAVQEDSFDVPVKYGFVDQFSNHLYSSPRRAIEELVCNGYDAGATKCYVSTPNDEEDSLQVLDNGKSMNKEGLETLWNIAGGEKKEKAEEGRERTVDYGSIRNRQQIGKFGVGKLAAYSLGNKLIHVATKGGETRIVSLNKDNFHGRDTSDPPEVEIYQMDEEDAKEYLSEYLEDIPDPWEQPWDNWTLAIVDDVDSDSCGSELKSHYLKRMFRSAIPREANFTIFMNNEEIQMRDFPDKRVEIENIANDDEAIARVESKLKEYWMKNGDYDEEGDVPSDKYELETDRVELYEEGDERDIVRVPGLGVVYIEGAIYEEMLTSSKLEESNLYEYGFKIRVKGNLLNRGNPKFNTPAKEFGYWHRCRVEMEMPKLDENMLVQRDKVGEDEKAVLARKVMTAFYSELTSRARKKEEEEEGNNRTFGSRIQSTSPNDSTQALIGAFQNRGEEVPEEGVNKVEVELGNREDSENSIILEDNKIIVNQSHPFFESLKSGGNSVDEGFVKAVGEGMMANLLTEGMLFSENIDEDLINKVVNLTDETLIAASEYLEDRLKYLRENLVEKSHQTDEPFERAVQKAFEYLGIEALHDGRSGHSDLILEVPRNGQENRRISVEVKGKEQGDVSHSDLSVSDALEHMETDDCDYALGIARTFQVEGDEHEKSKFLRQVEQNEQFSFLNVESLKQMLEKHSEAAFRRKELLEIIQNSAEKPEELEEIIESNWKEKETDEGKDKLVIETAQEIEENVRDEKPEISAIKENIRIKQEREISTETIRTILSYAERETGLVSVNNHDEFQLAQNPEIILSKMGS